MTISKADLLANEALALRLIGQHSIAAPIGDLHQKDAPQLQPILPTTWKSLEDAGYIRMLDIWHFQVTPSGWIKTLDATGKLCDAEMKKDLGTLCAALKDRLHRREGAALVGTHEIVNETGLPHYWVVNVIHSHVIEHCLRRKDANWAPHDEMESLIGSAHRLRAAVVTPPKGIRVLRDNRRYGEDDDYHDTRADSGIHIASRRRKCNAATRKCIAETREWSPERETQVRPPTAAGCS